MPIITWVTTVEETYRIEVSEEDAPKYDDLDIDSWYADHEKPETRVQAVVTERDY